MSFIASRNDIRKSQQGLIRINGFPLCKIKLVDGKFYVELYDDCAQRREIRGSKLILFPLDEWVAIWGELIEQTKTPAE